MATDNQWNAEVPLLFGDKAYTATVVTQEGETLTQSWRITRLPVEGVTFYERDHVNHRDIYITPEDGNHKVAIVDPLQRRKTEFVLPGDAKAVAYDAPMNRTFVAGTVMGT